MTLATDRAGQAANTAAMFSTSLNWSLLVVSTEAMSPSDRQLHAAKVFETWPKLCRAMAELEAVAPRSAVAGSDSDALAQDFQERRRGDFANG